MEIIVKHRSKERRQSHDTMDYGSCGQMSSVVIELKLTALEP